MGIDMWTQVTLQAIQSDDDSEIDSDEVLKFDPDNPEPPATTNTAENETESISPPPTLPKMPSSHSKRVSLVARLSKRPSMQLEQQDGWWVGSDYSDMDFPVDESFAAETKQSPIKNAGTASTMGQVAETAAYKVIKSANTSSNGHTMGHPAGTGIAGKVNGPW